jgi:uroporphyrin-III C-methyltransferase
MTLMAFPNILQFLANLGQWRPNLKAPIRIAAGPKHGHVSLVGAGPGSADLITLRGLERLQSADVVYYDRLADPALLTHIRHVAAKIYVGKAPGCHAVPQQEINRLIVTAAQTGQHVVRLKCGDPGIFGRGAEEAQACDAAGVSWDIVPGVTSACAAAAAVGSFLTERGLTERVVLATGHRRAGEDTDWSVAAAPSTTLALYMGVSQAGAISQGLCAAGWPALATVEVISRAQTNRQRVRHCTLAGLEAVCTAEPGLNPAILLIRWPALTKAPKPQMRVEGQSVEAALT